MKVLVPQLVRTLDVNLPDRPNGKAWLSAASGLVCVGAWAYVISDDEHHLGCFALGSILVPQEPAPLTLIRLFDGDLPENKKARKQLKPDLESLSLLPAIRGYPHGAMLAMGSGSKANRRQAVLISLDAEGRLREGTRQLDLGALYEPLEKHFADLNIEGAFVSGSEFQLLQRGNKGNAGSARICYKWEVVVEWLAGQGSEGLTPASVQHLDIGSCSGVPLSITDAAALDGGSWVFCAVAENTSDSYNDGACLGSIIGVVDAHGNVVQQFRLHGDPKVEGIAVVNEGMRPGDGVQLLLVTDADDVKIPSRLLQVVLPAHDVSANSG